MKRALILAALLVFAVCVPRADAGLIIQTGNNPQPLEENVLFNAPGLIGYGNPVTGMTNITDLLVAFSSSEALTTPSGGQARVEAADGVLLDYVLSMPGSTFGDYIFNLQQIPGAAAAGTVQITVNAVAGSVLTGTFALGQGENFFTVYATDSDRIQSVAVSSSVALSSVRQNRISGARANDVPEPALLLLFGTGLAGAARTLRGRGRS